MSFRSCNTISKLAPQILLLGAMTAPALGAPSLRFSGAWEADAKPSGEAVFARATALSSLAEPTTPVHLLMEFQLLDAPNKPIGRYEFWRVSAAKWRREIHVSGFNEVEIGRGDQRFVRSEVPLEHPRLADLRNLINTVALLRPPHSGQTVKSVRQKGSKTCVDVAADGDKETFCFDSATGHLLTATDHSRELTFDTYTESAGKHFPRRLRLRSGGDRLVEATLQVLDELPKPLEALFDPDEGTRVWDYCEPMIPAKAIDQVDPIYPEGMRNEGFQGMTTLHVVISPGGQVEEADIAESSAPAFDHAAVSAVEKWRFRPAMCGAKPVRSELKVEMKFRFAP